MLPFDACTSCINEGSLADYCCSPGERFAKKTETDLDVENAKVLQEVRVLSTLSQKILVVIELASEDKEAGGMKWPRNGRCGVQAPSRIFDRPCNSQRCSKDCLYFRVSEVLQLKVKKVEVYGEILLQVLATYGHS